MNTTGLFSLHTVTVKCKLGESFKLIPFGDVHRDSPLHSHRHWQEFLKYAKEQKNAYFLGMGDFFDGASTSERKILGDSGIHESTKENIDDMFKGVAKTMANEIEFMRGRTIGLLGGNHYWQFANGETTDHMLAHHLQTKFLGVCAFIRVQIEAGKNRSTTLDIFAHHGKGGGHLPGSTFNTIDKMQATADADIFLMGHDHRRGAVPSNPRLRLIGGKGNALPLLRERTPWLGRTGSFLKAYEPGKVSYNVDAARSACSLGWIEFDITPVRWEESREEAGRAKSRRSLTELSIRGTT